MIEELSRFMGDAAGSIAGSIMQQADRPSAGSLSGVFSLAVLIYSSTSVFAQLQHGLNVIAGVKPKPGTSLMVWLRSRLISLGMILTIAFLLLVSMVLSAALGVIQSSMSDLMAGPQWLWAWANALVSAVLFTGLFAMIFRLVPDVTYAWRDALVGGVVTALLFMLGQWGITLYFGYSNPGSAYAGVAGGLLVLLLWVYYSTIILFVGAEFTFAWAQCRGRPVSPVSYAVGRGDCDEESS